ncbi:hypothetical protein [Thiocystis violacea]|uniref:hypothetical protein n=1 Tax=Thiocystis violacea TaxID=13725 RepID=UPI001908B16F|nr:hypothetical protein [Thiocystis violacea]MBK1723242.1 hypothetical protein [Thiocystis violacea]
MVLRWAFLLSAAAGAMALELAGAWSLWPDAGPEAVPGFLAAHALGSGLFAVVILRLLRERLPSIRFSLVWLFCLLSPLLNVVFLGAAVALRLAPETSEESRSLGFTTLRPSVAGAGVMKTWERATAEQYDEAGLASVLRWSRDPERRSRAVLRSLRLRERESIRLLQLALRDPEDEVRLVAYGLLEHKTQTLTNRMQEHQVRLATAAAPAQAAALHRALAVDVWQLVSLGLVQGEVSRYYLSLSRSHLDAAVRLLPESPGTHFLRGRVLLDLGDPEAARTAFETARRRGLVPTKADLVLLERVGICDSSQRERPCNPARAGTRTTGRAA